MDDDREPVPELSAAERAAHRATRAWAVAQLRLHLGDDPDRLVPPYGSAEWLQLPAADPRRAAAIVRAAEAWRTWCEEAPARTARDAAFQQALGDHLHAAWQQEYEREQEAIEAATWTPILERLRASRDAPTVQQLQERRAAIEPTTLRATPGWPPIAIPGQPGRYLTPSRQEAAA